MIARLYRILNRRWHTIYIPAAETFAEYRNTRTGRIYRNPR